MKTDYEAATTMLTFGARGRTERREVKEALLKVRAASRVKME